MSVKAISWALDLELKPGPKLVLVVLADYADDNGYSFPSATTLARRASVSRSTLFRLLGELEDMGLLARERRRLGSGASTSNGYRLNPAPPCQIDTPPRVTGDTPPVSTVTPLIDPPSEPPVTTTARARQMPVGMTWDNGHSLKALARGVDVEVEFAKFTDFHLSKGSRFVDWSRAFHTWLNNARPERTYAPPQAAPVTPGHRMQSVMNIQDPRETRKQ